VTGGWVRHKAGLSESAKHESCERAIKDLRWNRGPAGSVRDGTRTYYDVLGVQPSASDADIDDAHRRLSAQCLSGSMPPTEAEAMLIRVREAYATLGDPGRRADYDKVWQPTKPTGAPLRPSASDRAGTPPSPPVVASLGVPPGSVASPHPTVGARDEGVRAGSPVRGGRYRPAPIVIGAVIGLVGLVAVPFASPTNTPPVRPEPTKAAPALAATTAPTMTAVPVSPSPQVIRAALDAILQCDLIEETFTPTSSAEAVRPCGTDEWVARANQIIALRVRPTSIRSMLMGIQVVGVVPMGADQVVMELVERWSSPPTAGATASDDRPVPQRVTLRSVSGQWKLVSVEFEAGPASSTAPPSLGNDRRDADATDHLGAALALRDAGNLVGAEQEIGEVLALGYTTATNDALVVRAEVRKAAIARPTVVPQPSVTPAVAATEAPLPSLTAVVPQATVRVAVSSTAVPPTPRSAPAATPKPAPTATAVPMRQAVAATRTSQPVPTRAAVMPQATVRVASLLTAPPPTPKPAPSATNPPQANAPPAGFFTVGSTKDEVLAKMGQPTSFGDYQWTYAGVGNVEFDGYGKVANWSGKVPARLVPKAAVAAPEYLTQGSTKDEVLAKMGQPTSFGDYQWTYAGVGNVEFDGYGKVANWSGKVPARLR
jgi:hypothetical protein